MSAGEHVRAWISSPDCRSRFHSATRRRRAGSRNRSRPNILLIQADDLGYGDLSAYGQSRFSTPSLDRLAREGIRFTEYYAGTTVCAPSRTTLMTGMHTGHAWIRGNGDIPLRPEDVTIAEVLRDAGYRTAVIGKWGLGSPGSTGMPDRQGFDHAFGFLDHRHAHRQYTDHLWRNGERAAIDLERDYVNDLFTSDAAAFMQTDDARPFFVYLNYTVPHAELRAPEDSMAAHRGRFPEQPFENPEGRRASHRCEPRAPHAGLPFAAGAARGVCRDDHAHGSRHRLAGRSAPRDAASIGTPWSCSSATTVRIRREAATPCSSRARGRCAASSATCTKAAYGCR